MHHLNIYNGGVYSAVNPLLGCTSLAGNFPLRLGDKLINAGLFARVVFVPIAIGATPIAQWATGGALQDRIATAYRRCVAVGLPVTGVLWHQGETDADSVISQATYQAALSSVIDRTRLAGFSEPFFVAKVAYPFNTSASNVRAAQAAVINHGNEIWEGPDTDTLTGANRDGGNVHFSAATGANNHADAWKTAIDARF